MKPIACGIYEVLIDQYLHDILTLHPELRTVFGKIDPEEQPAKYASFVAKVLEQALREEPEPEKRLALCNRILGQVSSEPGREHLEILAWSQDNTEVSGYIPVLPFSCSFELHAQYGSTDILAGLGQATLQTAGQRGVGVFHFPTIKAYVLLITYQKTEREFSPSTMYADYPISRDLLHWESQSNTTQQSATGQNLINHADRNYTILIFARDQKKRNGVTVPFTYLGPADHISCESERPIKMVWGLKYQMPVEMFEDNRRGG